MLPPSAPLHEVDNPQIPTELSNVSLGISEFTTEYGPPCCSVVKSYTAPVLVSVCLHRTGAGPGGDGGDAPLHASLDLAVSV
jgi:hypothetical protein